jgi:hypothetical protein
MTDLRTDLADRWLPSQAQMALADTMIVALGVGHEDAPQHVITVQVLKNKHHGLWTTDVEVIPVDGIFTDRNAAYDYAVAAAANEARRSGVPCTGSYAYHPEVGSAAVFEA